MPNVRKDGLEIVFKLEPGRRLRRPGRLHLLASQHGRSVVHAGQPRGRRQHGRQRDPLLAVVGRPAPPLRPRRRHLRQQPLTSTGHHAEAAPVRRPPPRASRKTRKTPPGRGSGGVQGCSVGTAYRIRTGDLRLERAVSWASRRMRHGRRRTASSDRSARIPEGPRARNRRARRRPRAGWPPGTPRIASATCW